MIDGWMLVILCLIVGLAGFIDSIAGGGGLISLSAYVAFGIPSHYALGTNKFSSFSGSLIASAQYVHERDFEPRTAVSSVIGAFVGSAFGSRVSLLMDDKAFAIMLFILVPALAVITIFKKDWDHEGREVRITGARILICLAFSILIGFYDGFFGPGTGMFLTLMFALVISLDSRKSCGNAKLVNLSSNAAALATFIINKVVVYQVAIPCALCSMLGNFLGSRLVVKKGAAAVKPMMLIVMAMLLIKVGFDIF
jgi:uncharacterized membrane protein YfcA